ncbi:MAG: T9SS type A sorting domain-containing protein [Flavobacteriales bacterium]|nr:T9SS type A sorting domain-containing protein [Flavobacteriales bacterium]
MSRNLLLVALLLISSAVLAQDSGENGPDWSVLIHDEDLTFEEVQAQFEAYWEGKEIAPGSGWKPFKRWELLMEGRLTSDGKVPQWSNMSRAYQEALQHRLARSEEGNWQVLGPILDIQTTRENIPGIGRMNTVAFHPTDPNIIFCGAPAGGLWRSYDGGNTWESNTDDLPTLGVSAIAFDPFDPDIVYIGTGDRDAGDAPGMGVMKSTDGGVSWEFSNEGMEDYTIGDMKCDPENPGVIIAATDEGVHRSDDYGASWEHTSNSMFYKEVEFKPGDSQIVYATAQGRFFRSDDNGQSFSQIGNGLTNGTRNVIAVTPANPEYVYICSANQTNFRALFKSTDSGISWEEMSDSPNILDWSADGSGDGGQAWYDLCMNADPVNPERIYVGGIRMKRSDDGGVTWIDMQNSYLHVDQHWLEFSPHTNELYLANDGGMYRLENGTNWIDISSNIVTGQIYKFGQAPFTGNDALTGYQDNGTMIYNGVVWDRAGGADGFECQYDPTDEGVYYNSIYYGQVYRTNDNVTNQKIAGVNELGIDESGAWLSPWFVSQEDENTMFLGMKNVWRCRNIKHPEKDSLVWERISNNLGGNNLSNMGVLIQHRADTNVVYGTEGSRKLFRTNNALANAEEVTWDDISNSLPWVTTPVTALESHPDSVNWVYLGFDNKVWKSIDQGENWEDISGTLPDVRINSIVYELGTDEGLYIGTDMGIYYREAGMDDWTSFSNGLPLGVRVTELEIFYGETAAENRLRASTYGRGLWESDLFGSEVNVFPATAWALTPDAAVEVFGEFEVNIGFYRNLTNIDVTDFDIADVNITNGTVTDLTGGPVFTATIEPDAFGLIELTIPDAAAIDLDGLDTYASDTLRVLYKPAPEEFGIYGPGGVGDEDDLTLWLRADEGTFSTEGGALASAEGDPVQQWEDISGNGYNAFQESLDARPTLSTDDNGINGFPAIEFNGENQYFVADDIPSSVDVSVFSVARGAENQWNDHGWIASCRMANGFILHPRAGSALFNVSIRDENDQNKNTPNEWIVDASAPQIYGLIYEYNPESQIFQKIINGNRLDYNDTDHGARQAGQPLSIRYGWDYDERFGEGQIAEHFIYGRRLYESQRVLVSNYLAVRYGVDLGPDQLYGRYDMPMEVAGIGQETEYDKHTDAQGRGAVRMLEASDMEDGEYLIWGHDFMEMVWESTGYPLTSPHVDRTWAYEQTGDVGTVEVRIYAPELDNLGEEIGIVASPTTNFEPGVLPAFFPLTNMGDYLVAQVDFEGSGVFTVGTQPAVSVEDLASAEVNVFPNPVNEMLNVSLSGADVNDMRVRVYDNVGQLVFEVRPDSQFFAVSMAGYAPGFYTIEFTKNAQRKVARFIKQ